MAFEFFSISTEFPEHGQAALNRFLKGHRIVAVERQLVSATAGAHWAFCVEYAVQPLARAKSSDQRIDYMQVLNAEDFRVFSELRKLRKVLAEQASVPPYTVFLDAQLAEFVTGKVRTREAMAAVEGVGETRMLNYSDAILTLLQKLTRNPG